MKPTLSKEGEGWLNEDQSTLSICEFMSNCISVCKLSLDMAFRCFQVQFHTCYGGDSSFWTIQSPCIHLNIVSFLFVPVTGHAVEVFYQDRNPAAIAHVEQVNGEATSIGCDVKNIFWVKSSSAMKQDILDLEITKLDLRPSYLRFY